MSALDCLGWWEFGSKTAQAAAFENKTHDFPQRVIYRRCGADLCAAVEGEIAGKVRREAWRYRRLR